MDKLKETFGIREKYSLENARHLCEEVEHIEEMTLSEETVGAQRSKALEASLHAIRSLTEVLVWMDRNNEEWFERVMERDVVNTVERLVTNGLMPSAVKLQGLQSITVLLQNLSRTSSIYYVCSNNHINRMVAVEFDMHDDEFVSLYVSFLKTLALRCTPDTVQFFFDLQDGAFPLWDRAVRLLASSDAMVRTAAKQIIVTIAQLNDKAVSAFVQRSATDVFASVMRNVDELLTRLAADVPSQRMLLRHVTSSAREAGGVTEKAGLRAPSSSSSPSPSPQRPPMSQQQQQQQLPPLTLNSRSLTQQLEDVEDELLYLNDVCRSATAQVGNQAAATAQRLLFPRLQRIVCQEVHAANSAAAAATSPRAGAKTNTATHVFEVSSAPSPSPSAEDVTDIPASVALAFLLFWLQVNTDLQVCAALMGFLVRPAVGGVTGPSSNSSGGGESSIAALVFQSSRVDLHEAVAAVFQHALMQSAAPPPPASSSPPVPLLHFPSSLSQFYFADTPYQQTGQVLVGGPNSTLPPPKDTFVRKAWIGGAGAAAASPAGVNNNSSSGPPAPQEVLAVLMPHLFAAVYTQLRYFHVTRLSCFATTLSLLVRLLPVSSAAERRQACATAWETAYVEILKLIDRLLLDRVKQYASTIQKAVRAQRAADGEVPLSRITFEDIEDSSDGEAPLPIRDPYTVMFLKLRAAALWLDADVADRKALLSAAHAKKDLFLFFPAFPTLEEERCDVVLNMWPPLTGLHHYQRHHARETKELLASAYGAVQSSVSHLLPLPQRSPATSAECELNLYVMFLLARHTFESRGVFCGGALTPSSATMPTDILSCTLRRLWPQFVPSQYFTLSSATTALSARCELAGEWHVNQNQLRFAALGTPMCLVIPSTPTGEGGRELLLLDVNDTAPISIRSRELSSGEFKRRVLLSLDMSFVGIALDPKFNFKVVVSYQLAGQAIMLHLVLCDALTAKSVVTDVEKAANECRAHGASFCFGIMNYRSALLE